MNLMVPTWIGEPGKMRKLFPVREKSGNFEQTRKVWEFTKILENEEFTKILKNEEI